ncbi:MAG: DUF2065 domain-containing protein [Geminicoccaceae bacterium]
MSDFLTAVGLVLVIEGVLWALFPATMRRAAATVLQISEQRLRQGGLFAVGIGVLVVYFIRG